MRCPHCGELVLGGDVLSLADLVLDPVAHEVLRDGSRIALTHTEYELLTLLAQHVGQVLTYSQVYERIYGCDLSGSSSRLHMVMSSLRRKLGKPQLLHTVRSVGYVLRTA